MRTAVLHAFARMPRPLVTVALIISFAVALVARAANQIQPVRSAPKELLTVNPGFRDWGPTTIAGNTILGGNMSNRGGLFAIDMASGKVRWTLRPAFKSGTASVSTPPAVAGDVVIVPFAAATPGAVIAVSLASGKEVWRGPDPERGVAVATDGTRAYTLTRQRMLTALDVKTGKPQWTFALTSNRAVCESWPVVFDGTLYLMGEADATPGDKTRPEGYYLFAIDAATGQERWRYRAEAPYVRPGVCLRQPVVTSETIYAAGDEFLYAIDRGSGRDRWKPVEVRRVVEKREQAVKVHGLVDAGAVLVGLTDVALIAFDKTSGRIAWDVPGAYNPTAPGTAVAGDVLYFQGSPASAPAAAARGTLHALDLKTRSILWSFSRPTEEANWPFGFVTAVDGAIWVDSYQALVKLQ